MIRFKRKRADQRHDWGRGLLKIIFVGVSFTALYLIKENQTLKSYRDLSSSDNTTSIGGIIKSLQISAASSRLIKNDSRKQKNNSNSTNMARRNNNVVDDEQSDMDLRAELQSAQKQVQQLQEQVALLGGTIGTDHIQQQRQGFHDKLHLPLAPWEIESLQTDRCEPPEGIPMSCCMRATNNGPGAIQFTPDRCSSDPTRYQHVQEKSLQFLEQHPLAPLLGGTTNGIACDICRIVDVLLAKNWTLSFVGDSMQRQSFAGFQCELLRRGYQNMETTTTSRFQDNSNTPPRRAKYKYSISDKSTITFPNSKAKIEYFGMYRINPASLAEYVLNRTNDNNSNNREEESTDILVFDHSLWYRFYQQKDLEQDLTAMLQTVWNHPNPPKLLVWREQSAQHFDAPGGHWGQKFNSDNCTVLREPQTNWETVKTIQGVARNLNISFSSPYDKNHHTTAAGVASSSSHKKNPHLHYIPFRDFTGQFHDIHPQECTHYCSTPYLWLPYWRTLRIIMDQQLEEVANS